MEQSTENKILKIKLQEATLLAEKAHQGQKDKAGQSYFMHPQAVSEIVCNIIFSWYGEDESYEDFFLKAEIVSLLHDVLEDTSLTVKDLQDHEVPYDCIEAIKALTKIDGQDYHEYLTKIKSNRLATVVKIADLTHNSDLSRLTIVSAEDLLRQEKYQKSIQFLGAFQCAQCGRIKHTSQMSGKTTYAEETLCASCVDKYNMEYDKYEKWLESLAQGLDMI